MFPLPPQRSVSYTASLFALSSVQFSRCVPFSRPLDLENDTVNFARIFQLIPSILFAVFPLRCIRAFPFAFVPLLRFVSSARLLPSALDLGSGKASASPSLPRKEVIQPHLPIRLPCYDFTPVIGLTFDGCSLPVRSPASGAPNSHGVTGGVYKARERIHRDILIRDY